MEMMDKALAYARWGFNVHPLRGKVPILIAWQKKATTDEEKIRRWWTANPNANIGCQPWPWAIVLDIDPGHGGLDTWAEINGTPAIPDDTLVTLTGSRGWHIWYRLPYAGELRGLAGTGIDLRSHKNQVVMPGSIHPETERAYTCQTWCNPVNLPVLPVHLRRYVYKPVRPPRPDLPVNLQHKTDGSHLVRYMAEAPEGQRNSILHWCACRAYENGYNVLAELAHAATTAGLDEQEIGATLRSAEHTYQHQRSTQ